MKLSRILSGHGPHLSCEFFPPKTDQGEQNLWSCIQELQAINPAYVSVTYGAGGSTQERTKRIVTRIKAETALVPVAHLTCVGATRDEIGSLLDEYAAAGIENILALRGDAPEGMARFEAVRGGFAHATDLVAYIRSRGDFSIGVATYPEGHPESTNGIADDIRFLKLKQDNGADAVITQYFFDNDLFFRFRDRAVAAGVTIPLIPGIMPIGNFEQIIRFSQMCGASIPELVHQRMAPLVGKADATKLAGIELAIEQCRSLLAGGVHGLHFYTLNRSEATLTIAANL